ncbi:MAG: hypothetical protein KDB21_10710 [Acidimicrobiales bacterium]|nr:hypothetical protein [Acidimicrobiales bacterium]
MQVTAADVVAALGRTGDAGALAQAEGLLPLVVALARSYTRGVGFEDEPDLPDDLAAVIVLACCRLVPNAAQLEREATESYQASGAFIGWTLAELVVLNGYRRRTA